MKKTVIPILALCSLSWAQPYEKKVEDALKTVDAVAAKGPFQPNWQSLENTKVPAWYEDGKFGIFIHWGVYAVPAFGNEWYPRNMYLQDDEREMFQHHVKTYGPQSKFGYKDFIPQLQGREVRRPARGRSCSRTPGRSSSCRWPSTTTASRCTTARSPNGARPRWGPSATSWATGQGGSQAGPAFRRLLAPRRALVVLRRRNEVRLRREGPALRRTVRPRAAQASAGRQERQPTQPGRT